MTPDTFISAAMNAAVCPTIKEQEEGAVPRWQGSVPPADGASLEEGGHEADQMLGAAPDGGGGSGGAAGHVAHGPVAQE